MPKVSRNYQREDFTELLSELQKSELQNGEHRKPQEAVPAVPKENREAAAEQARRRRSSMMDDRSMRYVYAASTKVLHDRDCRFVNKITDTEFEMAAEFPTNMKLCKCCYRRSLIRSGIGSDGRRIDAYLRFFDRVKALNTDLYSLLIIHHARLEWIDNHTMLVWVKEDSWKILWNEQESVLYHNNYLILEDYTRYFTGGYHKQTVYGKKSFHNIINVICGYDWSKHVERFRQQNDIIYGEVPKEQGMIEDSGWLEGLWQLDKLVHMQLAG